MSIIEKAAGKIGMGAAHPPAPPVEPAKPQQDASMIEEALAKQREKQAAPFVARMADEYGAKGLAVIGVCEDAEREAAQNFARAQYGQSQDIWWAHARALQANGLHQEAWAALQRAYEDGRSCD